MAKAIIICTLLALASTFVESNPSASKIHPKLQKSLQASSSGVNVFVAVKDGSTYPLLQELGPSVSKVGLTHGQRTTQVASALKAHAEKKQRPLLEFLATNFPQIEVKGFWIVNQIYLKNVDAQIIETLAGLDLVAEIQQEETSHIKYFYDEHSLETSKDENSHDKMARNLGWEFGKMRIPEVWNLTGNTGFGLVIGNIDTGVRGTHVLFKHKWVGLENNGWLDPEGLTPNPHDVYNHGTHTMGTLVGDNGIGIAPSARWLACKGYRDDGTSTASTFISCCEYMLCPTDYQGNNPDCSKAPHVVSNSWGWTGDTPLFNPAIHAWNTAGIVSSFSAGNTGQYGCTSIYSPADQPDILAVGATDQSDRLTYFSSLGPSPDGILKPEISAPGYQIYSASSASDTAMMTASGTSMSCPCATGVLALLKGQDQDLFQSQAVDILQRTSNQEGPTSGNSCDGISDEVYPNNHMGYGRIDAYRAMVDLIGKN